MIAHYYSMIMDPRKNPLRNLTPIVRFQLMSVLALMWSIIFCTWFGLVAYTGASMFAHTVLLIGIFFTADAFRRARAKPVKDHRQLYRDPKDGGALYDDIWGG
jgi:hypothetical protein